MDCATAREWLQDDRRGRLAAPLAAELRAHLSGCEACRREDVAERLLDAALSERLPPHPAPPELRRRVAALLSGAPASAAGSTGGARDGWTRRLALPAVAALALLSAGLLLERQGRGREEGLARLADEVVTDHLRLLASVHPHDVESSVTHEVKPWFEGRLDFAPSVPPDGGELRLLGGAVAYLGDRKAAAVSYALRRHRVTLLAFPLDGLAWPVEDRSVGGIPVAGEARRGFSVLLWRAGELGYALVSDVSVEDLSKLAAELAPATRVGVR